MKSFDPISMIRDLWKSLLLQSTSESVDWSNLKDSRFVKFADASKYFWVGWLIQSQRFEICEFACNFKVLLGLSISSWTSLQSLLAFVLRLPRPIDVIDLKGPVGGEMSRSVTDVSSKEKVFLQKKNRNVLIEKIWWIWAECSFALPNWSSVIVPT